MKKIVVIDSGIGGMHILAECLRQIPNYQFVYVADTFNSPYGSKSKRKLRNIASSLIDVLEEKYNPELYVIACNTLTVNTISFLRKKYKKVFVGVEPPIKQAKINGGNSIIFATQSTLKQCRKLNKKIDKSLKQKYKMQKLTYFSDDKLFRVSIENFPQTIENNLLNLDSLFVILKKYFQNTEFSSCKNLIIGCTHYTAIVPQIRKVLPTINICNNTNAVVRRVKSFCKVTKTKKETPFLERVKFLLTDGDEIKKQKFLEYFKTLV